MCHGLKPFKLSLDKPLTWQISFLLALASAKMVEKLLGLPYQVKHLRDSRFCTFSIVPGFLAKVQNPSILDPKFFGVHNPFFLEFCGWGLRHDAALPCRALRKYLSRTEEFCPACANLFISATKWKKCVSRNTFILDQIISHAYRSYQG